MPLNVSVFDALSEIADFDDALTSEELSDSERRSLFMKHLQRMDKLNFTIPGFKKALDWLNVSKPLLWDDALRDQIVVLDFFTYCCVNCLHILPDLKVLEETHPSDSGVVVVGVHSAKFANEKVTANILSAVLRYGIKHPVVNDTEAFLWQELSVSCWPTLLFVGPSNQLLYTLVGEGHLSQMMEFVTIAKEYYTNLGQLKKKALPIHLEEEKMAISALRFPGKVYFWPDRSWLVITDTGNHRVVITDKNGVVQEVIGASVCGFQDGTLEESCFSSPQGVVCAGHQIYVADTGNHTVRLIDLINRTVSTLVGTGSQGSDKEGGKISTQQELASPWDLAFGPSKNQGGRSDPDVLYIAMAGSHQIWVYFLQDTVWHKGKSYPKGTCVRFAGSGAEENRNNFYPEKAGFAQPSGLALSRTRNTLYIADSESSTVRAVSLTDGKVSAVVGAEKDPMNLFASGDLDGKGVVAKLQHPLGVALVSPDGPLLVADSYNHKLKAVDLNTNTCESLVLTRQSLNDQPSEGESPGHFNEPGGVDVDQTSGTVYVADTNNHSICVVDFKSRTFSNLPVIFSKETKDSTDETESSMPDLTSLTDMMIPPGSTTLTLTIPVPIEDGKHMNKEAPNGYSLLACEDSPISLSSLIPEFHCKGQLRSHINGKMELTLPLQEHQSTGSCVFLLSIKLFLCLDQGNVCLPPLTLNYKQTIHLQ